MIPPPDAPRLALARLSGIRERTLADLSAREAELAGLREYLGLSVAVGEALEKLGEEMLGRIARLLEENLSRALQEVLEQNLTLKVVRDFKRGRITIAFHIERDGKAEDIIKGQGGSVANVLSVGLRLFALRTLDEREHRRFLVLDEQDCWLRPDLVPRLVRIVRDSGRALGFQVLMISHHDTACFQQFADRIYYLLPTPDGVAVKEIPTKAALDDDDSPVE